MGNDAKGNDSMAPITNIRRLIALVGMDLSLAAGLIGLDVVARLLPHAPNFTPLAASAVFAGMILRSRALALSVPISAMLASDFILGGSDWRIAGVVYGALVLPAMLAICARRLRAGRA